MEKKVVHYAGEANVWAWPYQAEGEEPIYVASLHFVWDHPKLNQCWHVRTSEIVSMPDEKGNFETLNTLYVRSDEAPYKD